MLAASGREQASCSQIRMYALGRAQDSKQSNKAERQRSPIRSVVRVGTDAVGPPIEPAPSNRAAFATQLIH